MISISKVEKYVDRIAKIISSVLGLQVIICDSERYIIGDSHLSNYNIKRVGKSSILYKAMLEKKDIVLSDKKNNHLCESCKYFENCDIEAIVSVAIVHDDNLIGGIEILANNIEKKNELLINKKNYLNFIHEMSELLIIKLFEEERTTQLNELKERLSSIIESIDHAIVSTDEKGNIIYHNSKLCEFADAETINNKTPLTELIKTDYLGKLHSDNISFKNKEIKFHNGIDNVYALMSGKPIFINNSTFPVEKQPEKLEIVTIY